MKVYIVESGEYSSRGIDAVFSTREKAEEYVKYHRHGYFNDCINIAEWDLDDWNKDFYIYEYACKIDEKGTVDHIVFTNELVYRFDFNRKPYVGDNMFYWYSRKLLDIKELNDIYSKFKAEENGLC